MTNHTVNAVNDFPGLWNEAATKGRRGSCRAVESMRLPASRLGGLALPISAHFFAITLFLRRIIVHGVASQWLATDDLRWIDERVNDSLGRNPVAYVLWRLKQSEQSPAIEHLERALCRTFEMLIYSFGIGTQVQRFVAREN